MNPTLNIDSLAKQGMLFQNSFCTSSICGPSRAVIQTGKHSQVDVIMTNSDRFNGDQQMPVAVSRNKNGQSRRGRIREGPYLAGGAETCSG